MVHKIREIKEEYLTKNWGKGRPITFNGKKYRVGKMSYGDFFFEPWKERNISETVPFSDRTLWLAKVDPKKKTYKVI